VPVTDHSEFMMYGNDVMLDRLGIAFHESEASTSLSQTSSVDLATAAEEHYRQALAVADRQRSKCLS
jgi:hypothetical protein